MANTEKLLEERGSRYGDFATHALITQSLKNTFYQLSPSVGKLTPAMCEAIDMIFHKLGRIGNGDPTYVDSWDDIAGYATLVSKAIEKDFETQILQQREE